MKIILTILFSSFIFLTYTQQVIQLCEFERKEFTYTTYSQQLGTFIWDINGDFLTENGNNATINWSDYQPGNYTITVYFENNYGCSAEPITFNITIVECRESFIYAPNAFTPDGDTHNNEWKPIAFNISNGNYIIFNRWGETIFESYDLNVGWPGTYGVNGRIVKDGVYVYVIEYLNTMGVNEKLVGHITLLK
jgi:gliding motility-associated-like protein